MKNSIKSGLCILTLFCIIILSGCSKQSDKTVVQFASWGSKSEIDILKPILNDFENKNPNVKIDFIHIPQNYFQKIHLLFASNNSPDVIFMNNLYLPIYANAGLLMEMDNFTNQTNFYPQSLKTLSWKDKLYAIPRDVSNVVIYYNKDLFDKNHVEYPSKNWTFEEFLYKSQKLTHRPNAFGTSFEEDSLYYLPFLMSEGGGVLSDDLSKDIIDSPESQKGLNFYADLRNKYHTAPQKSESASATMAQMFLQEKLAMHLSGRWLVPKYREEAKFNWDVTSFPKGDKGSIVPMDASGWAIAKSTKHPQEAKKLVQYLSSRESIEKFSQSGLIVPARIDVSKSEYFLDTKHPQSSQVFLDVIKSSKSTPVPINYKEVIDKLSKKLEYRFNN